MRAPASAVSLSEDSASPQNRYIDVVGRGERRPPAQIALAWLLAQGDDIAPIPGTKRVARVEENTAADPVTLSAEQIERLIDLTPAVGERHYEGNMARIER